MWELETILCGCVLLVHPSLKPSPLGFRGIRSSTIRILGVLEASSLMAKSRRGVRSQGFGCGLYLGLAYRGP